MTTSERVNETAGVALSEHVHHARLIQVNQFDKIFNFIVLRGIGLWCTYVRVCVCVCVYEYCSGVSWDRPIFNGTVCW